MSTHRIRSPTIRAILIALADQPAHIAALEQITGFPRHELSNAMTRCMDRLWVEPAAYVRRADDRLVAVYALTDRAPNLTPAAPLKCGQDRLKDLLTDEARTEAELAELAEIKPISVRTLLENLRAAGHAVAVDTMRNNKRMRGWILRPICVLDLWITGELFRRAA